MDRVRALIERHGLAENEEYIIIPFRSADGSEKKIFLLRRPYLLIRHDREHAVTVPLHEIMEALIHHPEESLWETLHLAERLEGLHGHPAAQDEAGTGGEKSHHGSEPPKID